MMLVMAMMVGMFAFGALTVGAAGPTAVYKTDTEIIEITGADADNPLWYALKYDISKHDKTKWFPVVGDGDGKASIDVAKFIPKKFVAGKEYKIAFVTDLAATSVDAALLIPLAGRGEAPAKDKNGYGEDGKIALADSTEWRLGIGNWQPKTAFSALYFDKAEYFPFGAVMEVRTAPAGDLAASAKVVKIKISAQPKAPKVVVKDGKLNNKKDALEFLDGTTWKKISAEKITVEDLAKLFETEPIVKTDVTFRSAKAGKKPYSATVTVKDIDFAPVVTP